jgi:hypothetical protein
MRDFHPECLCDGFRRHAIDIRPVNLRHARWDKVRAKAKGVAQLAVGRGCGWLASTRHWWLAVAGAEESVIPILASRWVWRAPNSGRCGSGFACSVIGRASGECFHLPGAQGHHVA